MDAQPKGPTVPLTNSKALARAAFKGDYETVWNFLSPGYKGAVSHSKWLACQKKNPVAPPGVTINKISIANQTKVPVNLPMFGSQQVQDIFMQVIFTRGGTQSAAVVNAYWFLNKDGKWVAVWLPSVYSKYKSGGCDPYGPTRGLY
jgi:hypothetical protein